jgi:hypothetical protein
MIAVADIDVTRSGAAADIVVMRSARSMDLCHRIDGPVSLPGIGDPHPHRGAG